MAQVMLVFISCSLMLAFYPEPPLPSMCLVTMEMPKFVSTSTAIENFVFIPRGAFVLMGGHDGTFFMSALGYYMILGDSLALWEM